MEDFKIYDEISKSKGYEIALLTTFNFDVGFFERSILYPLFENGIRKVSLFVDSKELNKSLENVITCNIGQKYLVNPIEMNGTFHPKVILLLGPNSAKLFIASANLTQTGYSYNNEIFNTFLFDENHPENLKIINKAIDFFIDLYKVSFKHDEKLFEEIRQLVYYNKPCTNDELYLLHNIDIPILNQISDVVKDVEEISIAAPYYDNELSALKAISSAFPTAKITLYLQDKKCKFPVNIDYSSLAVVRVFESIGDSSHFYHGKVFLFKNDVESFILYGSANCTQSALVKKYKDSGNVECDVLEKGGLNEFDEFFDSFNLCAYQELHCDILDYTTENSYNFFFRYGILESSLDLYFGFNKKENIKVTLGDIELLYVYDNNMLKITIPIDIEYSIGNLFKICFAYGNTKENITCWYINPPYIEQNRCKEAKDVLDSYEIDSDSTDKYIQDQIAIIRQLSLSRDEYEREKNVFRLVENDATDDSEEASDENGIISYVIPSADVLGSYNKYIKANKIKSSYIKWYLDSFRLLKHGNKASPTSNTSNTETVEIIHPRKSTSEERRFRNFVKNRIKEMLVGKLDEVISTESYLQCILMFFNVFDKYTLKEKVEDMFDARFIADAKYEMISRLLRKEMPDDDDKIKTIKLLSMQALLDIHRGGESEIRYEMRNKELIDRLNTLFDLREAYVYELVEIVEKLTYYGQNYNILNCKSYIDRLFGYLPYKVLESVIKMDYGKESEILMSEDCLTIRAQVEKLADHMEIKINSYNEICKYALHYKAPAVMQIYISTHSQKRVKNGDPAKTIKYEIDIKNRNGTQTISRLSGKTEKFRCNLTLC